MTDTTKDQAIAKAKTINELHGSHDAMQVIGEADATGAITVRCSCGVDLLVPMHSASDAVEAKPAEAGGKGRRVFVQDVGGGKDGG